MKKLQIKVSLKEIGNSFMNLNSSVYFIQFLETFKNTFTDTQVITKWNSWSYTHEIFLKGQNFEIEVDIKPVYGAYPESDTKEDIPVAYITNDFTIGKALTSAKYIRVPLSSPTMKIFYKNNDTTTFTLNELAEYPALLVYEIYQLAYSFFGKKDKELYNAIGNLCNSLCCSEDFKKYLLR